MSTLPSRALRLAQQLRDGWGINRPSAHEEWLLTVHNGFWRDVGPGAFVIGLDISGRVIRASCDLDLAGTRLVCASLLSWATRSPATLMDADPVIEEARIRLFVSDGYWCSPTQLLSEAGWAAMGMD